MMGRRGWLILTFLTCAAVALDTTGQAQRPKRYRRAKLPEFKGTQAGRVFFDDVFSSLVGQRPRREAAAAKATTKVPKDAAAVPNGDRSWSRLISAATLEDEIKSLKLEIDKVVTTPSSFAGRGHKQARADFAMLAILFAIVSEYDGDVRWKEDAPAVRDMMARTASNLKAGGSIQVYNESKKRKQELGDLVRGSRLQTATAGPTDWETVVDRSPLMQLLETRFERNLKQWTGSKSEFQKQVERIVREAELAAAIAAVLVKEGMEDAEDEEYQSFAALLEQGGVGAAQAAKMNDAEAAEKAVVQISRSCVDCHESYR